MSRLFVVMMALAATLTLNACSQCTSSNQEAAAPTAQPAAPADAAAPAATPAAPAEGAAAPAAPADAAATAAPVATPAPAGH